MIEAQRKEIERLERIEIKYKNLCPVLNEQAAEIDRLQRALAFWLPGVPNDDSAAGKRCGDDAMLLVGFNGVFEPSAEDLGWIKLSQPEK
jgi:hypothetical protein